MRWLLLGVAGLFVQAGDAGAFCRVVAQRNSPKPQISADQPILFIYRKNVELTPTCTMDDGGSDGGFDDDAGPPCTNRRADLVTLVFQPVFESGSTGARFAILTATPSKPLVTTAPPKLFDDLAGVTEREIVYQDNYIADLPSQCESPGSTAGCIPGSGTPGGGGGSSSSSGSGSGGSSGGGSSSAGTSTGGCGGMPSGPIYTPPTPSAPKMPPGASDDDAPPDLAAPPPDPYQVVVLTGADEAGVRAWLDAHEYLYGSDDLDALRPYLALGWTVVALQATPDHDFSNAALGAIAFTYERSELRLPLAIARQASGGTRRLVSYLAADTGYALAGAVGWADYSDAIGQAMFLTRTDATLALDLGPDADPIAVRGDATIVRPTEVVYRDVHVPKSCADSACALAGTGPFVAPIFLLLAPVVALVTRRRRSG